MKCQSLFSGKNKKTYMKLSSADIFLSSMLSINIMLIYFVTNIEKPTGLMYMYHITVSYWTLDIMIIL